MPQSRSASPELQDRPWAGRVAVAAAIGLGVVLALLSRARWFDRDEGFYAMAAALVRAGRHPWRDFAYPQGPLLPFLLAPFGADILVLRWISVGLTVLLTFLLVRRVAFRHSAAAGLGSALLLLACPQFTTWMPTLKTYAPAGLLSVGALLLVTSDSDRWAGRGRAALRAGLAGLLIGAATAIRLPCLVLVPLAAGWLALHGPPGAPRWRAPLLLLGVAGGILAAACAATGASLDQMTLNGLRVGLITNPHPWRQRLTTLLEYARDPGVLLLVVLGLAGFALAPGRGARRRLSDHHLAGITAVVLTGGYLLALPTFTQYFTFSVPFWVWSAAPLWGRVAAARRPWRLLARAALVGWLGVSVTLYGPRSWRSPYPWQRYFAPREVAAVQAAIATHLPAGTPLICTWPGFLAGTRAAPWPGLESTVSFDLAAHLKAEQRRLVPNLSVEEVRRLLIAGAAPAVILTTEDQEWHGFDPTRLPAYAPVFASDRVVLLIRRGR